MIQNERIVIAGGSGFLGKILIQHFKDDYDSIVVLTRGRSQKTSSISYVNWDAKYIGPWQLELEGAEALINLTGRSVDCRYTEKNKKIILNSRLDSTKILGVAVGLRKSPPKVWINSSTATIYRHAVNKQMDETTGEIGKGFSVNVAKAWEEVFFSRKTPNTRKVAIRTSIVLGQQGGALLPLKNLAKIGLGGKQGKGTQKISWIHEKDFARAVAFITANTRISGVLNLASPDPLTNAQFMAQLRKTLGIPIGLTLPKGLLELGAILLGTETELILKSRNVIPRFLQSHGFTFLFPDIARTLKDLVSAPASTPIYPCQRSPNSR
ncbi:MAG: TIGR01777 family oxidoreductase [Bacteroidota bacterium]